jgi:RNA polymerase sigma-70 factor (ECF subfamily)
MSEPRPFEDLIDGVRRGDASAAAELVRNYEPEVRRTVRMRLTDMRLRRVLDSVDICQSVLANFFVRAAAGQFELDTPSQLLKLLVTMARNRLFNHAEAQRAARRDNRRQVAGGEEVLEAVAAGQPTPSQVVADNELLQRARQLLSDEERYLADQRALGRGWPEIAQELGGDPEALRKRLSRAMDRVAQQLGLDGPNGP